MSSFSLPDEIRSLPVDQRMILVEELWNSIVEDEASLQLSEQQKAELDRRLEMHKVDPNRGVPWEEVKNRLLGNS